MICSQKFRKIRRKLELLKEISKLLIRHLRVSSWFSSCVERGTGHAVAGSKYGHLGKRDVIIARHQQSETTLAGKGNFGDPRTGMHGRNRSRLLSFWHKYLYVSGHVCHLFWLESHLQVFFWKSSCVFLVFPLVLLFSNQRWDVLFFNKWFTYVYLKVAVFVVIFIGRHVGPTRRWRPSWNERSWSQARWMPTFASSIPSSTLVPRTEPRGVEGWWMDGPGRGWE